MADAKIVSRFIVSPCFLLLSVITEVMAENRGGVTKHKTFIDINSVKKYSCLYHNFFEFLNFIGNIFLSHVFTSVSHLSKLALPTKRQVIHQAV